MSSKLFIPKNVGMSKADIIELMNQISDEEVFEEDDERVTDEVCQRFVDKLGYDLRPIYLDWDVESKMFEREDMILEVIESIIGTE